MAKRLCPSYVQNHHDPLEVVLHAKEHTTDWIGLVGLYQELVIHLDYKKMIHLLSYKDRHP
jgi:hypothetical protein